MPVLIWFNPFDTLMVFLKEFLKKVNFEKKTTADDNKIMENYPTCKELLGNTPSELNLIYPKFE